MSTRQVTKIDLRAQLKWLYQPSAKSPSEVEVPSMQFLMIDGAGDPNDAAYRDAVGALYAVAYTLKFAVRNGPQAIDYPIMPLEGLWWMAGDFPFEAGRRGSWRWTAMIMQPSCVTAELVAQARDEVSRKKGLPAAASVRLAEFHEGTAAQILYRGPFAAEPPTIARLHAFIAERGHHPRGKHHEIYLNNPLRTAPENLKTVLRQPYE